MSKAGGSFPPPPRRSSASSPASSRDTKSSLYEAALAAVEDRATQARARTGRPARKKRRFLGIRVLLMIGALGLGLLAIRPAWLAGPRAAPPESAGIAAASFRIVLLRERDLVTRFLLRSGRLPASLIEAGSAARGVQYRRQGDGFVLSGRAGDSLIVLRSGDSGAVFLGESLNRLKGRGRERP